MSRQLNRVDRVAAAIQRTLAHLLATRVKDPRVGFVTLTHVSVTSDLSLARVWVSVMGGEREKREALEGLASASGFLRSSLAHALDLRTVPSLRFELDRGLEHAARIDELLDQVKDDGGDP